MSGPHVHHWEIESPAGPVSIGRCRCGQEKDFFNTYDDAAGGRAFNRKTPKERIDPEVMLEYRIRLASAFGHQNVSIDGFAERADNL